MKSSAQEVLVRHVRVFEALGQGVLSEDMSLQMMMERDAPALIILVSLFQEPQTKAVRTAIAWCAGPLRFTNS